MARQRLDLNLDTQRLLAANRERAAANRSAYVDRGQTKRTAAQTTAAATPATPTGAPTQNEEPRGGTPNLYRAPEPAAQRRKKKGVEVYGISNVNRFYLNETTQESYQTFTGYGAVYDYTIDYTTGTTVFELLYYNVEEKQFTNSYRLEAARWRPEFNQELPNSRRFFLGDPYTVDNAITHLDWTFDQRSDAPYFAPNLAVKATPPALPFLLEDKVSTSNNAFGNDDFWGPLGSSLTRSDGKFVYHSRLLIKCAPASNIVQGSIGPIYEGQNYESFNTFTQNLTTYRYYSTRRGVGSPGIYAAPSIRWQRQNSYGFGNPFSFYGLYWRFDPGTGTTTFGSSALGVLNDYDWVYGDELNQIVPAWFDGMHPGDPSRRLWKAYEDNYSNMFSFLVEDFLYESDSFLQRWPPGLVYNEETGVLTIVTGLNGGEVTLTTPRIFSKEIGPNVNYFASIPIIHLPSGYNEFLTTEQDFLDAGWTAEGTVPESILSILDPLDQYFAFKP